MWSTARAENPRVWGDTSSGQHEGRHSGLLTCYLTTCELATARTPVFSMDSAQLAKLAAVAGASGAAVALLVAKLLDGGARRAEASAFADKPEDKRSQPQPRPLERQASSVVDAHVCSSERVQKFVLTGGPCGGKTTALARLRQFLEERGFRVVCHTGLEPQGSAQGRRVCYSHV